MSLYETLPLHGILKLYGILPRGVQLMGCTMWKHVSHSKWLGTMRTNQKPLVPHEAIDFVHITSSLRTLLRYFVCCDHLLSSWGKVRSKLSDLSLKPRIPRLIIITIHKHYLSVQMSSINMVCKNQTSRYIIYISCKICAERRIHKFLILLSA